MSSVLPGVQTFVDPVPGNGVREDQSREPDSALPALKTDSESGGTKWSPSPRYRAPVNVKNKHRTKPEAGEEYGHPVKLDYNMPTRRHFQASIEEGYYRQVEAFLQDMEAFIPKQAATMTEIVNRTAVEVDQRSDPYNPKLLRADPKSGVWKFKVGDHKVTIKGIKKGSVTSLAKAHLKVSCSCPFFRYYGPEHWAQKHGYLYGKPQGTAARPDQRDPEGKHWACKHVIAALWKARKYRMASSVARVAQRYCEDIEVL